MAEKDILVLSDKQIIPTDEYIFSIIGEKKILWQTIMDYVSENCKNISGNWNYYNDGKQWLFKLVQKKKTIFWAGILSDTFRVTFYFGDKAESLIEASELPSNIKNNFKNGKRYGKIRAISLIMSDLSDVEVVKLLIQIKIKVK
jgi:Protein of unknown function (DUF3788)